MASIPTFFLLVAMLGTTRAIPPQECYDILYTNSSCGGASANACFLLCGVCSQGHLGGWLVPSDDVSCSPRQASSDDAVFSAVTQMFFNVSALQGRGWLDDSGDVEANATQCFEYLLTHMPRRDLILLLTDTYHTLDFLFEHIRFALLARRSFAFAQIAPWDVFLDNVLPYAFLTEKRDLWWHWRPRLFQTLSQV